MAGGAKKLLYALGGSILGGIAGSVTSLALGFLAIAIPPIAPIMVIAPFLPWVGSVLGAVQGWSSAARQQASYGSGGSVSTSVSRSMSEGVSPELTREQALAQVDQEHTQLEAEHEAASTHTHGLQVPAEEKPKYAEFFKPTVSKAETVQAERVEPQQTERY